MSRVASKKTSSVQVKKFCKVCQDAGKTEEEYRSHFTRETVDPKSKVVCPTLLALKCRFCNNNGHTVKYCNAAKNYEKTQKYYEDAVRRIDVVKSYTKGKSTIISTNAFACLESESEDDDITSEPDEKEEFPQLSVPSSRSEITQFNYAAALSKPAPVPISVPIPAPAPAQVVKKAVVETAPPKAAPWASSAVEIPSKTWAAWDSDLEDEYEDWLLTNNNLKTRYDDDDDLSEEDIESILYFDTLL